MKLLIVEDEEPLRQAIAQYLKKEGFVCEHAADFREGYRKIIGYDYDLVVLDLQLPKGNGMQLLKLLRENKSSAGVIILSSQDSPEERIEGLDQGADDFLVKPFSVPELLARIKAVMRRKAHQLSNQMDFGDLVIRLDSREVWVKDVLVNLTRKEFDILVFLARNKNRVVTKDSIAEHLWGDYMDEVGSFDFIYAHLKNLRKKLDDHGCSDYLKTVYGVGYKFVAV